MQQILFFGNNTTNFMSREIYVNLDDDICHESITTSKLHVLIVEPLLLSSIHVFSQLTNPKATIIFWI